MSETFKTRQTGQESSSTRDRILAVALELFSSKGYLGATTREIARTAGIAEVTLFRHFPSKEHLLEEVINRYTFLPTLRELITEIAGLPYEEALIIIAERQFETLIRLKDWIRIMHVEVQRSSSNKLHTIYHAFLDELFKTLASFLRDRQMKEARRDFDPELAARAFHGMLFSYFTIDEVLEGKKYKGTDREKVLREFVQIFVKGTLNQEVHVDG